MTQLVSDSLHSTHHYVAGLGLWNMLYLGIAGLGLLFFICVLIGMTHSELFTTNDAIVISIVLFTAVFLITFITVCAVLL